MEQQELEKWREAGRIASQVMDYAKKIVKPDMLLLELAEKIDSKIIELGGNPAFPVNLSINEIAAHSTPAMNDEEKAHGLLKIDIGVNIDGYISDMACSVDLTSDKKYAKLIEASREALDNVIEIIKPGIMLGEIGAEIQKTIEKHGFTPIVNLSGHELQRYLLHAGLTIPNIDTESKIALKEGQVIALEPFATTGQGIVQDGKPSGIYKFESVRPVRDVIARDILKYVWSEFKELPFCSRQIAKKFGAKSLFALHELEQARALHHFKQLVEKTKAPVSQAEHTILVTKDGCEVLTKEG